MTTMMICLLNLNFTGVKLHEILGLMIFFLFLFHIILNFKWIKSATKNLFNSNISKKVKISYVVDIVLLVLVVLNISTGVLISKYFLTVITANNIQLTSMLHHIFAYVLLIMLIVHIGLHWKTIRTMVNNNKGFCEKIILFFVAVLIVLTISTSNTVRKLFVAPKESNSHYKEDEQGRTSHYDFDVDEGVPTIEDFLSKLICTGCGRHCLLTNLECGRGSRELQEKVQEYNEMYGVNESYNVNVDESASNKEKRSKENFYNEQYEPHHRGMWSEN